MMSLFTPPTDECDCEHCACRDCGCALSVVLEMPDYGTQRCQPCHERFVEKTNAKWIRIRARNAMSSPRECEFCDTLYDYDEHPTCPGCLAESERQGAYWRPLWEGERQAGLVGDTEATS